MSLNCNCGKSGQTILIFCMMLPVGLVLCMPGQYWVFLTLTVIIAARRGGMLATRHCRYFIGISANLSIRVWWSSPWFWGRLYILVIAQPSSPQYAYGGLQSGDLAGCSILVMLPCWRKSRTTQAWHGEVWCYGSSSYPLTVCGI